MKQIHPGETPIIGVAMGFFETGTEGVRWTVCTHYGAPRRRYENIYELRDGDQLTIFEADGSLVFHSVIDFDWQVNWCPHRKNPAYGQQAIGPCWVHGVQRGVSPDQWADWFWGHEVLLSSSIRQTLRPHPLSATLLRAPSAGGPR